MKKIAIGVDDFKKIIENDCYYVDKTLFIKEIIDDGSKVLSIQRPRRFGKTLNLSMLNYYFQNAVPALKAGEKPLPADNGRLFSGLKIMDAGAEYTARLGAYPVISMTLKDVKHARWQDCYSALKSVISKLYESNYFLTTGNLLSEPEKKAFNEICSRTAEKSDFESSIKNLSDYLYRYYGKKVVILIDEYDMPIQAGYINGYYGEIIEFMRNMLSGALKGNISLEKSVLSGILRVAKESIFSGLNNLHVSTLLSEDYSDHFGFSEEEVARMLEYFGAAGRFVEVKKWYNGYIFGNNVIYNPWSMINFCRSPQAPASPYWINTSSNDIIKDLLKRAGAEITRDVQTLIGGGTIEKTIDENIVYGEIDKSAAALWSFFLMSGYLKPVEKKIEKGRIICRLAIPNEEVRCVYEDTISGWFNERGLEDNKHQKMLECLVAGDIARFEKYLQEVVLTSFSYFDITESAAEKVYHAFIMGLMIGIERTHLIRSNRESGYGRYDLMLAPKAEDGFGFIFEFKKADTFVGETLETACDEALKQIEAKEYKTELKAAGVNKIIEIALAFEGKKVMMRHRAAE